MKNNLNSLNLQGQFQYLSVSDEANLPTDIGLEFSLLEQKFKVFNVAKVDVDNVALNVTGTIKQKYNGSARLLVKIVLGTAEPADMLMLRLP